MTPHKLAAILRQLDHSRAIARAAIADCDATEAELVSKHEDLFPFTVRGRTYEAWRTRNGRAYARVTIIDSKENPE